MDIIKKSIEELSATFTTRMDEFQKEVKTSTPEASHMSHMNAQFQVFRAFVMTALENLQLQLQLLSRQQDDMEARSRSKILLVHGVAEVQGESPIRSVSKLLSEKLSMSDITESAFSRFQRMGRLNKEGKPRPLLIKFQDQDLRNKVWFSKARLKGSGITVSEFLTRGRHEAFLASRKRFGVSQCFTRDGCVIVLGAGNKRHRVFTLAEVNALPDPVCITPRAESSASVKALDVHNVNTKPRKPATKK